MAVLNSAASKPLLKLTHRASLTLHDYSQNAHLISNPPYCEMPYHSLNTSRITAMCGITKMACGECVRVCGQAGCEELLVADRCTGAERDLDISTKAGMGIFGDSTGKFEGVDWQYVAQRYCANFWTGEMSTGVSDEVLKSARMTEFRRMKGLNTSFEAGIVVVEAPDPAATRSSSLNIKGTWGGSTATAIPQRPCVECDLPDYFERLKTCYTEITSDDVPAAASTSSEPLDPPHGCHGHSLHRREGIALTAVMSVVGLSVLVGFVAFALRRCKRRTVNALVAEAKRGQKETAKRPHSQHDSTLEHIGGNGSYKRVPADV